MGEESRFRVVHFAFFNEIDLYFWQRNFKNYFNFSVGFQVAESFCTFTKRNSIKRPLESHAEYGTSWFNNLTFAPPRFALAKGEINNNSEENWFKYFAKRGGGLKIGNDWQRGKRIKRDLHRQRLTKFPRFFPSPTFVSLKCSPPLLCQTSPTESSKSNCLRS